MWRLIIKLSDHEKHSIEQFGKPYTEIHVWLDEFAGSKEYGMRHRKVRHHLSGIEEAVKIFGEESRAAALQHIVDDLHEEGWSEDMDELPKNRRHYEQMGLF